MSELSFVVCIIDQTVGILQSFPPEWIQSILGWQLLLLLLSRFSRVQLCATPQTAATRLPRPWDSPGKNTGVGCHFLLQCMKVKSESEVSQSCPTLSDPMDYSPPGSSVHGIFQARVLECSAIAFSIPSLLPKALPTNAITLHVRFSTHEGQKHSDHNRWCLYPSLLNILYLI